MKKFLLLGVAIFVLFAAQAQKVYFIYLQSDNGSPFYLKMGDKIASSTSEGYLILPKLIDSTYSFHIGRPAKSSSEVKFTISINKSDRGFLLKEMDGVLHLFDMQTMELIKPTQSLVASDELINNSIKRTDAFTVLLAKAADDSTLLYMPAIAKKTEKYKPASSATVAAPVVKTEPEVLKVAEDTAITVSAIVANADVVTPKIDTVAVTETAIVPAKDTVQKSDVAIVENPVKQDVAAKTEEVKEEQKEIKNVEAEEYKKSIVSRYSESSTSAGFGLVFLDNVNGVIDTVRILIPNPTSVFKSNANPPVIEQKQFLDISSAATEKGIEKVKAATDSTSVVKENVTAAPVTVPQSGKVANCKNIAMESDFKKLRKYMAAKESDNDMIEEAKKTFKTKCFATDQIKNLSALFLSDEGKYKFFETAYSYIIDPFQYSSLQSELKDEVYVKRFKALTGN